MGRIASLYQTATTPKIYWSCGLAGCLVSPAACSAGPRGRAKEAQADAIEGSAWGNADACTGVPDPFLFE